MNHTQAGPTRDSSIRTSASVTKGVKGATWAGGHGGVLASIFQVLRSRPYPVKTELKQPESGVKTCTRAPEGLQLRNVTLLSKMLGPRDTRIGDTQSLSLRNLNSRRKRACRQSIYVTMP